MSDDLNDIDLLMLTIDEAIAAGKPIEPKDLDRIIAYQRKMRVQREAGVRTKKPAHSAPSKLDVSSLLAKPIIGGGGVKRRF